MGLGGRIERGREIGLDSCAHMRLYSIAVKKESLNLSLEHWVKQLLRVEAAERGIDMSTLVTEALMKFLNRKSLKEKR